MKRREDKVLHELDLVLADLRRVEKLASDRVTLMTVRALKSRLLKLRKDVRSPNPRPNVYAGYGDLFRFDFYAVKGAER